MYKNKTNQHLRVTSLSDIIIPKRRGARLCLSCQNGLAVFASTLFPQYCGNPEANQFP